MTPRNRTLAVLAVALAACGGEGPAQPAEPSGCRGSDATSDAGNLLRNPGFEEGHGDPWYSKASWGTRFSLSRSRAHSGERSARLALRSSTAPRARTRVYGLVQDLCPRTFPDVVRGHFFVERWEQGTPAQYLQVVAIVHRAENLPDAAAPAPNHQLRYILAGAAEQPTAISNARYRMLSTEPPPIGRWVPFELELRADFAELWGEVPHGFEGLDLFFEARYDGRGADDGPSAANVYYDDLYVGPAGK